MPVEVMMVKHGASLVPATEADREELAKFKTGKPVKVRLVRQSDRSLRHHRMFFGGLLRLGLDYWEPAGGVLGESEEQTVRRFAKFLDREMNGDAIAKWADFYLADLKAARADRFQAPAKSMDAFRHWVLVEAGHSEVEETPRGLRRRAKSINFESMGQEDFNELYKSCFSVIWKFVLSRHFATEGEAQQAIDELLALG